MSFKDLLANWRETAAQPRTATEYAVHLPLDEHQRLRAIQVRQVEGGGHRRREHGCECQDRQHAPPAKNVECAERQRVVGV